MNNITSTVTKRPVPKAQSHPTGRNPSNPHYAALVALNLGECLELRGFENRIKREHVAMYANALGRRLKRRFATRRPQDGALDIYRVA